MPGSGADESRLENAVRSLLIAVPLRRPRGLRPGCRRPLPRSCATDELAHAPPPAEWKAAGAIAGAVEDDWLATFADAQLEALVAEAMQYNGDLRVAAARAEQAAGVRESRRRRALSGGHGDLGAAAARCPATTRAWRAGWSAHPGSSISGDGSATASAAPRSSTHRRKRTSCSPASRWRRSSRSRGSSRRRSALQRELLTEAVAAAAKLAGTCRSSGRRSASATSSTSTSARVTLQTYRDSLRQVRAGP